MRRWLLYMLSLALLLGLAGCKSDKGPKPTKLMGKLYSRMSTDVVVHKLKLPSGGWQILEDRHPVSGDGHYAWRWQQMSLPNYTAYGQQGELRLSFFNDQLLSVQFYPQNLEDALAAVNAEEKSSVEPGGDALISKSTRLWVGRDEMYRSYIGWVDKILQAEKEQALQ